MGNVRMSLPDNLHRNLKQCAIDEDIPMREVLIKDIQVYIENNPPMSLMVTDYNKSNIIKNDNP